MPRVGPVATVAGRTCASASALPLFSSVSFYFAVWWDMSDRPSVFAHRGLFRDMNSMRYLQWGSMSRKQVAQELRT